MFTTMLEYKAKDHGCKLVKVGKDFKSTETCSQCGHIDPSVKKLKVRKWTCSCCGTMHDRDLNAAVNIKNEGLRLLRAS